MTRLAHSTPRAVCLVRVPPAQFAQLPSGLVSMLCARWPRRACWMTHLAHPTPRRMPCTTVSAQFAQTFAGPVAVRCALVPSSPLDDPRHASARRCLLCAKKSARFAQTPLGPLAIRYASWPVEPIGLPASRIHPVRRFAVSEALSAVCPKLRSPRLRCAARFPRRASWMTHVAHSTRRSLLCPTISARFAQTSMARLRCAARFASSNLLDEPRRAFTPRTLSPCATLSAQFAQTPR